MDSHPQSLLPGATQKLAEFAAGIDYAVIPAEVIDRMKTSFLDSVGCCLFGATLPWTQRVQAMIEEEGARPVASIFGVGKKTSVAGAVLVNSTAGHAFELDDIHKESIVHAGSIATPVVVALAATRPSFATSIPFTTLIHESLLPFHLLQRNGLPCHSN
jgi:2-methylcitrate dehydratase PrpD